MSDVSDTKELQDEWILAAFFGQKGTTPISSDISKEVEKHISIPTLK
jgi:hypothetical protein